MINQFLEKINEYKSIVIFGHVRPDGDCLGSQFGLKNILKNSFLDKKIYVVGENSTTIDFIDKTENILDDIIKESLGIVVDTANIDRVSDQRIKTCPYIIKIDHHINKEPFGNLNIVVEEKAATALLILDLVKESKGILKLNEKASNYLYMSILTDTGRFRYGDLKDAFIGANLLIENGADPESIDSKLSKESLNVTKFKGYVLKNFKISPKGVIYIYIKDRVIKRYGIDYEEASNQVGLLMNIENTYLVAYVIESGTNIRVRLRSKSIYDVDKVANKYNGGGHKKASGCKLCSKKELSNLIHDLETLIV